ncbi:MAG TPA: glycosyltransferase family 2 protein [Candidatus Saccharimonadales bacterium]|nr:glycosyltransferase family 2 protein [Candidatus Saccharimonadales bacterium]
MHKVVSVVIPTKDRLRFLKKAIAMYLKYPEVGEIIVVIDGSTDGTKEYLESLARKEPRLVYVDNGTNRGIPYSRNRGISAAKYDYIFSTEDDLEVTGAFFSVLLNHLQKTHADVISGRNIFRFDWESAEQAIRRTDKLPGNPVNLKRIEINTSMRIENDQSQLMIASPMLFRTDVFKQVRFDEIYKVNFWREETDFQISCLEKGYKLISCPHAVSFNYVIKNDKGGIHTHDGLIRSKWVIRNNWAFIKKHGEFIDSNFDIGNRYIYITKFAFRQVYIGCIRTLAGIVKYFLRLNRSV